MSCPHLKDSLICLRVWCASIALHFGLWTWSACTVAIAQATTRLRVNVRTGPQLHDTRCS